MTGLLLLFVMSLWIGFAIWLSVLVARGIKWKWRLLVAILFFFVVLPLPLVDEIIGRAQFRSLCAKDAMEFRVKVEKPEGRVTRYSSDPLRAKVPGALVPITRTVKRFTDTRTSEVVVEHTVYEAGGGFLIRALGISNSDSPLLFNSTCSPTNKRGEAANLTFKFSVIN
jgi:hypothetical protein